MQVNGFTITYTDDNGLSQTMNALSDWTLYQKLIAANQSQKSADATNANAQVAYVNALHDYQSAPDVTPIPAKPKKIVVSDLGKQTETPFDPPLPDPVITKVTPSTGTVPVTHEVVLNDFEKMIVSALSAISNDLAAIKKQFGVV